MKKVIVYGVAFCLLVQNALFCEFVGLSLKNPYQGESYLSEVEVDESENVGSFTEVDANVNDTVNMDHPRWIAYYGNKALASSFYGYDPIVFYPRAHPILAPLMVAGKTLLAYVSFGDISVKDFYYQEAKTQKLILEKSPFNNERFLVDVRNPNWEALLLSTIIPEILTEGFGGVCICNIDSLVNLVNLELYNPQKYAGVTEAAISLLGKIRQQFPGYKMMIDMQGLLHMGDKFVDYADMLLYEHLSTKQEGKSVTLRAAQEYALVASQLQNIAAKKEGVQVYTLDFWPTSGKDNETVVANIYAHHRSLGFIPYVSRRLSEISSEPALKN
jgi:uncharacterized protein (TIGR01370 family)